MCVVILPACMSLCVPRVYSVCGGQKRASSPHELALQMLVSYHVDAENWRVLCKNNVFLIEDPSL